MKKIVLSILVLMLAAPAMAIDVTFTAVHEGTTGVVRIYYDANSPPGALPRAFALDITVDNSQTIDAISDLSADYWVYPGSIDINDQGEVNDFGTPVADYNDLPSDTELGLNTSGITIEMGSLYVGANEPDPCALLLKVEVSGDCNLTVTGNVGRGKAVLEGAAQAMTNLPVVLMVSPVTPPTYTISGNVASGAAPIKNMVGVTIAGLPGPPVTNGSGDYTATVNAGFTGTTTVTVAQWTIPGKSYTNVQADALNEDYTATATECLASTDPGYTAWTTTWSSNPCWCYRKQCRGDTNGTSAFGKPVSTTDLDLFKLAFGKTNAELLAITNGICADLNHTAAFGKQVTTTDLDIFKLYFGIAEASVPQCPSTNINAWTN